MKGKQRYHFCLSNHNLSQIEGERSRFRKQDKVDVTFTLTFLDEWHPSKDEKHALLDMMDEFKCTEIVLNHSSQGEIDPEVKEILTKASKTLKSLKLIKRVDDELFQLIHELIVANGGIQQLQLEHLKLSKKSWELFNSHKLGTGREDSSISFVDPKRSDEVFAQVLENLSGFKILHIDVRDACFPEAFQRLGQVLSKPDCELSKLGIKVERESRGNCIGQMLETLMTNTSVTELKLDASSFTDDELTSIMKQIHKLTQLTELTIGRLQDKQSLDFLRPLLDNSSRDLMMNPSIQALNIHWHCRNGLNLSEVKIDLLVQVARRYPKLGSFGKQVGYTPELQYTLRMNSKWRQYMTREPEFPLSLWRFVLEDVEKEPTYKQQWGESKKKTKAAIVASIRYELVQHIVHRYGTNLIAK